MNEIRIDPWDEENCCKCVVCGGHRAAYSDPPVCKEPNCLFEWNIATSCQYCHAPDSGKDTCDQCGKEL